MILNVFKNIYKEVITINSYNKYSLNYGYRIIFYNKKFNISLQYKRFNYKNIKELSTQM